MKHPKIVVILAIVGIVTFLVMLDRNRNRYGKQSNSDSENYDKFGQKTHLLDKSGRIFRCVI